MIKNFLIAAALVIASPALVFSQDLFISFSETTLETALTHDLITDGATGTAYLFADGLFGLDALDLDITSSNSAAALLSGGTAFNEVFTTIGGTAFNSSVVTSDAATGITNLFSANITENGINPALSATFNPGFQAGVGPNGAVLLAELTFDAIADGVTSIDLALGTQGALQLPDIVLDPSFGSGTLTVVGIPEPSSAALLVLGSLGLFARRRRS